MPFISFILYAMLLIVAVAAKPSVVQPQPFSTHWSMVSVWLRPCVETTCCAAPDGDPADSDEADADVVDDELDGGAAPLLTADYWQRLLKENWLRLQKVCIFHGVQY